MRATTITAPVEPTAMKAHRLQRLRVRTAVEAGEVTTTETEMMIMIVEVEDNVATITVATMTRHHKDTEVISVHCDVYNV